MRLARRVIILRMGMIVRLRRVILITGRMSSNETDQESAPMSQRHAKSESSSCPPTLDDLQQQLHHQLDQIIGFCLSDLAPPSFLDFEKTLWARLRSLVHPGRVGLPSGC